MSRPVRKTKSAKFKGVTYKAGEFYRFKMGDNCGEVARLEYVEHDLTPGILNENRVMLALSNGSGVNVRAAAEWLVKVRARSCPCPHGCQEFVEE